MTKWHMPTLWLVVSLIALILTFFIKCKKANEIKANGYDAQNYKDSKGAIDYKDDFIEKYLTDNYEDFNGWGVKGDRKYHSALRNKNIGTRKRKARNSLYNMQIRTGKINGNKDKKTRKTLNTIKYTGRSVVDNTEHMNRFTRKYCVDITSTLRARHKSCFLRPDTGPCRADIIQWYYDPRLNKCFRFFWGGCQGNGNKFENKKDCMGYCFLNSSLSKEKRPFFCELPFDFGTCFGHYYRWYWDRNTRGEARLGLKFVWQYLNSLLAHLLCKWSGLTRMDEARIEIFVDVILYGIFAFLEYYILQWKYAMAISVSREIVGVCKRRLYSGCGGNQNNFQSYDECFGTCVIKPNITVFIGDRGTTCLPID